MHDWKLKTLVLPRLCDTGPDTTSPAQLNRTMSGPRFSDHLYIWYLMIAVTKVLRPALYLIFVDRFKKDRPSIFKLLLPKLSLIYFTIPSCDWSFLLGNFEMSESNVLLHQNEMLSKSEQMSTSYPRTRRSSCSPILKKETEKRKNIFQYFVPVIFR